MRLIVRLGENGFYGAGSLKPSHPLARIVEARLTVQRKWFNAPSVGARSLSVEDTRPLSSNSVGHVSACRDAPMFLAFGGQETENET